MYQQYHILFIFLSLTYVTQYDNLYVHPCCCKWQYFVFYWLSNITFCIYVPDQIRSVAQSCPTLCDPMNRSTPGLPAHHQLPEFTGTHDHWSQWCHPAISSSVVPSSSCPQSFPASESFPMSQLFAWGGQSTGVSTLASFLPKKFVPHLLYLFLC